MPTRRSDQSTKTIPIPKRAEALRVGYVPLVDAAPIVAAEALGYFESAGVRVRLSRELGWGSIRDKIAYGELDAAHAPGGLLFSIICGTHTQPRPVATDLILNLQGNAITLSRKLWERGVRDGASLQLMIRSESRKPVFAVVSPFSSHIILLREWLRSAGINADRDVRIVILPPPLVGEHMVEGLIDGFCAGEPWNSAVALAGEGWIAATSASLVPQHPEKILLANADLMVTGEYAALRSALVKACRWCDSTANRPDLVELLHVKLRPKITREALGNSLIGPMRSGAAVLPAGNALHQFHRQDANRATPQRAAWYYDGLTEAGTLPRDATQRRQCLSAFRESHN